MAKKPEKTPKKKKKVLRRPIPHMTRMNKRERKRFDKLVEESGLNGQDYALCRLLYIPLEMWGGTEPKSTGWENQEIPKPEK